jgi:5'-3' exonuclease
MSHVIVDGNAIGYIGQSLKQLTNGDGQATQAVYHCAKAIPKLKRDNPDSEILVLWDRHCQWRYDLLPEYKGKRESTPELKAMRAEYRTQRPYIHTLFDSMGINQWGCENWEADDLVGFLTRRAIGTSQKIQVVTRDKDWLQLVNEQVTWYSPVDHIYVSMKNFHEYTGYKNGVAFLQGKALQGDSSDNIGGVGGLGKTTAPKVLAAFGTVNNMVSIYRDKGEFSKETLEAMGLSKSRKKINEFCGDVNGGLQLYKRNLKLMNLLQHTEPPKEKIHRPSIDEEALIDLFCELNFNHMATQVPNILSALHPHKYEKSIA